MLHKGTTLFLGYCKHGAHLLCIYIYLQILKYIFIYIYLKNKIYIYICIYEYTCVYTHAYWIATSSILLPTVSNMLLGPVARCGVVLREWAGNHKSLIFLWLYNFKYIYIYILSCQSVTKGEVLSMGFTKGMAACGCGILLTFFCLFLFVRISKTTKKTCAIKKHETNNASS